MHIRWTAVVCCLAVSCPAVSAEKQDRNEPEKHEALIAPSGMKARFSEPLLQVPWRHAGESISNWTESMWNLDVPGPGSNVFFPPGGSKVDASGEAVLRRHAILLKKNSNLEVTLVAYADIEGSPSYNLAIAEERLDSVAEILRRSGVPRGQIERLNPGREAVGDVCQKFACCSQTQRVELIYQ